MERMFCMSQPSLQTKKGNPVKTTEQMLKFNIDGEYRLLGIDNGNVKNVSPYQSKEIMTYQGRCILMLQATEKYIGTEYQCRNK